MVPVSILVTSQDRLDLLQLFMPTYLDQGCPEVVVVTNVQVDQGRAEVLCKNDKNVKVKLIHNAGLKSIQAKRTEGVRHCTQPYVFVGHDDVYLAPAHIASLYGYVEQGVADLAASTWLTTDRTDCKAVADVRYPVRRARGVKDLVSYFTGYFYGGTIPERPIVTPWLHDCALMPRALLEQPGYDSQYRGNEYRIETDLYLAARRLGLRMVFVPGPPAFHYKGPLNQSGGTYPWRGLRQLLWYEYWVAVNTYRFLRKNRDQLVDLGHFRQPLLHTFILMPSRWREWPQRLVGR